MSSTWGSSWLSSWGNSWGLTTAQPAVVGGGAIYPPAWYGQNRREDPKLRAKLRALFKALPEPVRGAIAAITISPLASAEAEERKLREAAEVARIEWLALYMRLLAYQREEMRLEEEAVVVTMIAALSR